jgi:hypothetical protein
MENLTTPFKASAIALLSHTLVSKLGMGDVESGSVATAAWMLLMGVANYVVPKDWGSSLSARMLAIVLRLKH